MEGSTAKTLAMRWTSGKTWTQQTTPQPTEGTAQEALRSVSCPTTTFCTAVGFANGKPFVERWNGAEWISSVPPSPGGANGAYLEAVSCPSASSCTAVGNWKEAGTGIRPRKVLAERWNGSAWSVSSAINPSEAKGDARLLGISCVSSGACYTTGRYAPKGEEVAEEEKTLAEFFNGVTWEVQASPNSKLFNSFNGVSCNSLTSCEAVGNARPTSGTKETVTLAAGLG
jgi:hypothetical protein